MVKSLSMDRTEDKINHGFIITSIAQLLIRPQNLLSEYIPKFILVKIVKNFL